ncbi:hypothetical protein [Actinomadura harenae]|uniref:Peptidase M15A C-terminal domain-containing protein n=1 Tax=Actinomadura harenae TaxID=2483351 RepID=A0A3M2MDN7_9ACTN|nr:hypothetical protein [Actinomadura harenae]RMI47834.1 hypothetical protein EBO15_00635 [Actinomadura harenae]
MRKRIICGLAMAVLPVAAVTASVPSWPHLPPLTPRAMASDGRTHPHRHPEGRTPRPETRKSHSDARRSQRMLPAARRSQARLALIAAWRPRAHLDRSSDREPDGRHTASAFALGDLPRRLSDLTARMAHAARGIRLSQGTAERMLFAHHIRWRSNGHCENRANPSCTSFQGLLHGSLDDLFAFARLSRCPLTVSGGTERGHARGRLSHGTGHKLDVMPTRCLDRFIPRRFRYIGLRGDGAELYRSHTGDVFAREPSHWDILMP